MLKAAGFEEPDAGGKMLDQLGVPRRIQADKHHKPKDHIADMTAPVASDMVSLPHHYARYKIEPIKFICENKLDFFQGNIVKYTLRHDAKNGMEDLLKVIRYGIMQYRFHAGDPEWAGTEPFTQAIKAKFLRDTGGS